MLFEPVRTGTLYGKPARVPTSIFDIVLGNHNDVSYTDNEDIAVNVDTFIQESIESVFDKNSDIKVILDHPRHLGLFISRELFLSEVEKSNSDPHKYFCSRNHAASEAFCQCQKALLFQVDDPYLNLTWIIKLGVNFLSGLEYRKASIYISKYNRITLARWA